MLLASPSEHHVIENNGNKERKPTKKGKVQQRGREKFSRTKKRTRKFLKGERQNTKVEVLHDPTGSLFSSTRNLL